MSGNWWKPTSVEQTSLSNLAVNAPAVASSFGGINFEAERAFDGNLQSRWASNSSEGSEPQWIYVDLGTVKKIGSVRLHWEDAYAVKFKIQVSNDGSVWNDVYTESNGSGGVQDIPLNNVQAKYVKMYGTEMGTLYGYSLYEFEVYPPN
ncbi:discoidin domain-containing protein [Paenibacillus sp. D2_2]|uniref:discoidin domain-containing protein n=1 Tax=Paenibacillus sp. D2_2 TaxID=3073092 RepID=UPI002814CE14|nr:discoidin domain-containing protein [Paenibacillus sp. D2_2]WMT43520.1 discoidin domain-containing protein [Paenibacillus sp. D2_2]